MDSRRRRQQLQLCVYAMIVAMSRIAVSGTTTTSSPSPSSSLDGPPPPCVFQITTSDALGACVTRPPAALLSDRTRGQDAGGDRLVSSIATTREGRGKKKKKEKNAGMNMIVGGGMMAAFVIIFMYLNLITVTLGKAFLFTFITKFLVSTNWKSSSPKKESSSKDVTVVMT